LSAISSHICVNPFPLHKEFQTFLDNSGCPLILKLEEHPLCSLHRFNLNFANAVQTGCASHPEP